MTQWHSRQRLGQRDEHTYNTTSQKKFCSSRTPWAANPLCVFMRGDETWRNILEGKNLI